MSGPSSAPQPNAIKWRFAGVPMMAQHFNAGLVALQFFKESGPVLLEKPVFL